MGEKRNHNFQKLTPKNDMTKEKLGIYFDALDEVFADKELKNVAISGVYGSGKSSILKSYDSLSDKRFMYISLANFNVPVGIKHEQKIEKETDDSASGILDKSDKIEGKPLSVVATLEGKILNQLLHQINPAKIQQTSFKTKPPISKCRIKIAAMCLVLSILALLCVIFFEYWSGFVCSNYHNRLYSFLKWSTSPVARIAFGTIALSYVTYLVYRVIYLQKTKNIVRRISFKGTDIEIFGDNKDSYFDKYLNEVVYLFDKSDTDAIAFEDMDRFNVVQIFARLREINTLVNLQREKQSGGKKDTDYKPLRFFYLLRDDIFVNEDRTKFFDFIIPVVPVIDGSNSINKLIELFKADGTLQELDQSFLKKLSLYINDMRLLLNSYNEFLVYRSFTDEIKPNLNKLFAIIVYKNLLPDDFSNLRLGKGYVYGVIAKKLQLTEQRDKDLTEDITQKRNQIIEIEEELNGLLKELLLELQSKQITESSVRNSSYKATEDVAQVVLSTANQDEYNRRSALIADRLNGKSNILKKDVVRLQSELERVKSVRLCNLIEDSDSKEVFAAINDDLPAESADLLKVLLRFGWIDENYQDYINYFHQNSISIEDKVFIRSVTEKRAEPPNYILREPDKVLEYLSESDFRQPEILNYSLMNYLLTLAPEGTDYAKIDALFVYLRENDNYRFIIEAIIETGISKELVYKTNLFWSEFLNETIADAEYLSEKPHRIALDSFILLLLYYAPTQMLKKVNIDNCVTNYIQVNPNFLSFGLSHSGERANKPDIEKLVDRFALLEVSFKDIAYEVSNKKLFRRIYEACLYEINRGNIWLMLRIMYKLAETDDFIHRNLSIIMSRPDSPLACYVWDNIEIYIEAVLSFCEGEITDDEQVAIKVLNNKNVNGNIIFAYLEVLKTKISTLSSVTDVALWEVIFRLDVCTNSQVNVLLYFQSFGIDDVLIKFINSHEALSYEDKDPGTELLRENFFDAIIVSNDIADNHYALMLTSLGFYYEEFDIENISKDKMDILVAERIVLMSANSLIFIRDNYPNNLMHYIEKNITEYVKLMTDELFSFDEALEILDLKVADEHKIAVLGFTDEPISVSGKGYIGKIKAHILNNNYNESDFRNIIKHYDEEIDLVKSVIERLVAANVDDVLENEIVLPTLLFDALLSRAGLTDKDKVRLFASVVSNLDREQFRSYLPTLKLEYYNRVFKRGQPLIPNDPSHERILSALQKKKWISSFKVDNKNNEFFRAYGWQARKPAN